MKKIAVILPSFDVGGTENMVANLAKYIDKDKFEKKLYEISAENFAKKVYLFYIDIIIEYNNLKSIEAERFPMKMEDTIRQMPVTVKRSLKREQIRAKYFARKASKLAKNLQSYVKIDKDKEQD